MSKAIRPKVRERHTPLGVEIDRFRSNEVSARDRPRNKGDRRLEHRRRTDSAGGVVPKHLSSRILDEARRQREEEYEDEHGSYRKRTFDPRNHSSYQHDSDEDSDELGMDEEDQYIDDFSLDDGLEVDEADERALELFMPADAAPRRTLADMILSKLRDHEVQVQEMQQQEELKNVEPNVSYSAHHPKVVSVYNGVGVILGRYRHGKLPKAFKIIPALSNWEDIVYLTNPHEWTPQAFYQATRLFASNLNPRMAQRYYNVILLPRVRDEIHEKKRLPRPLYMAVKKAVYKPGAFYKGIVLPLCESGDCTLREAMVIGSVIAKVSIPVLESAAALLRLAEMPYSGPTSLFIRVLLNKRYALPVRVIDGIVQHFCSFTSEERQLPVLWHQALLVFAQRYKAEFTPEQTASLLAILNYHKHPLISKEIKRELAAGNKSTHFSGTSTSGGGGGTVRDSMNV